MTDAIQRRLNEARETINRLALLVDRPDLDRAGLLVARVVVALDNTVAELDRQVSLLAAALPAPRG